MALLSGNVFAESDVLAAARALKRRENSAEAYAFALRHNADKMRMDVPDRPKLGSFSAAHPRYANMRG